MPQLNPLLQYLKDMTDRATEIDAPNELPREKVSCRNCPKAHWVVVDRKLTCICLKSAKVSWASTQTQWSVETTLCAEMLIEEAKEKHAKIEQREALASGLSEEEVLTMPVLTNDETPRHAESQKKITR